MKEIFFFDADCQIGSGPAIGVKPGVRELLADMDRFGIDRSLVRHGNCALLGAEAANRELAEMLEAAPTDRLVGVWCILPDQCPELPQGDEFFAAMKRANIRALTLMPKEHLFVPCRLAVGRIMDAARERKIPVLLKTEGNDWLNVYDFLREFPRNRVVIYERWGKWGRDRQLRPLLENYENAVFSFGGYQVPEGLRDLAELYGAERLIYGSGYPLYNQGCGMLQLKQSGLPDDAVAEIAGKNLEKMLAEVQL
ncbi:MAG: amidohydrolase family protein [Lentisphaeria bacterium]|nr:amidohydrolase family protein [Lentisphaeria bacterium]